MPSCRHGAETPGVIMRSSLLVQLLGKTNNRRSISGTFPDVDVAEISAYQLTFFSSNNYLYIIPASAHSLICEAVLSKISYILFTTREIVHLLVKSSHENSDLVR